MDLLIAISAILWQLHAMSVSLDNKLFCRMPWHSSFISPDGKIHACCISSDELGDIRKGDSIGSVWNNEKYQALRQKFLNGEFPAGCIDCKIKEERVGESTRTLFERSFSFHAGEELKAQNYRPIAPFHFTHLDISFSNLCNLRCRFCGPRIATKWIDDAKQLQAKDKSFWSFLGDEDYELVRLNPDHLKELSDKLSHLRAVEIKGGEPFLAPAHLQFLRLLIDLGLAANIELLYSTNGTVFLAEFKEIFSHFKEISLTVSVDGTGELYRYIRGEQFSLEENIEKNLRLYDQIPNLNIIIHFTLCAYNVFGICDFLNWYYSLNLKQLKKWQLGVVAGPAALRVENLPIEIRQKAYKQLLQNTQITRASAEEKEHFEKIKTYLLSDTEGSTDDFIKYAKDLDEIRVTNLKKIEPQFSSLFSD